MGRYSYRLFTSYTVFYILGLVLSMQIPFVGFQPIRTSEHMAASGVFALVMAAGAFNYIQTRITKAEFKFIFIFATLVTSGIVLLAVVGLTWAGVIAPWSGRYVIINTQYYLQLIYIISIKLVTIVLLYRMIKLKYLLL